MIRHERNEIRATKATGNITKVIVGSVSTLEVT
jgi:hypothetical protein